MGRKLILSPLVLLAAGCSWTSDGADGTDTANLSSNGVDYRQRIADMEEEPREALFLRAIVSAGLPCNHVESATAGTDSAGAPVWNVHCGDGHERTVTIAENGAARIVDADPPEPPAPAAPNSQ